MKKIHCLLVILLMIRITGVSQTSTNIGTEFWVTFTANYSNPSIQLFISAEVATSGTVSSAVPGVNQNFTVVPGVVTQLTLPIAVIQFSGIEDKGIHVVAADPVSVYGLNRLNASTDAFLALPVSSLGVDYRIMTYQTTLNGLSCYLSVVATQDATAVTIFNKQDGTTTNINLNQGQTYLMEDGIIGHDLTGSRVQSNFPVAVFGSVKATNIPAGCTAADHINEMMWPMDSWGKNFVTVPTAGRDGSGDIFRVLAMEDGTIVSVNGTAASNLNAGDFYETTLTGFNAITSNKAVFVAQFAKGLTCTGNITGDPFMMVIPPQEQFLTNYTVGTVSGFTTHWANIVAPDYALGTIYQDGVLIPNGAFTPIGTTGFYGAQRSILEGSHTFSSTFPFGVFMYGWNAADSYGYPGGGSLSPVGTVDSVSLTPATASGTLDVTTICLTAHVMDNFLNPVEGVLVNFHISGLGPLTGNAYTDATGNAEYCYTRTGTTPGIDSVYAEVFGFRSDTSTVFWSYVPPCSNPAAAGTIGNPQSGCSGFSPMEITSLALPSGQSGTLEFKWQLSVVSAMAGFTDIPASNAVTWTPGALSQTTWFRRLARVDCMADWTGAAESNAIEITVNPWITAGISIVASANPVCPGTLVTFTATPVNPGSSPVFEWKINGSIAGTSNPVFSYPPVDADVVQCYLTSSLNCITLNPVPSNQLVINTLPVPVVSFDACFDTITTIQAKPFKLKGGLPLGGTYSGSGVNSLTGIFNPSSAGVGTKTLLYTYANSSLCTAAKSRSVIIHPAPVFICNSPVTDIRDQKVYATVMIGTQCWMAENLDHGQRINGTIAQRDNCFTEKYCLNDMAVNCIQLGALYQWDEIMRYEDVPGQQGLCPPGWHIPTANDWNVLFSNWFSSGFAGSPLKYSGYSGFNALLAGVDVANRPWDFAGFATFFWSSTPYISGKAWAHGMNDYNPSVSTYPSLKSNAFSVRCIRD